MGRFHIALSLINDANEYQRSIRSEAAHGSSSRVSRHVPIRCPISSGSRQAIKNVR